MLNITVTPEGERYRACYGSLVMIRHAKSAYNYEAEIRNTPLYLSFQQEYKKNPESALTRRLAAEIQTEYKFRYTEEDTPIAKGALKDAVTTAEKLQGLIPLPDIICVSPFVRTLKTLEGLCKGWKELSTCTIFTDEAITEQRHGEMSKYASRRVYLALHPEEREKYDRLGEYYYCFAGGESPQDVHNRQMKRREKLFKQYQGLHVLEIKHHKTILDDWMSFGGHSIDEYYNKDAHNKPENCSVTRYSAAQEASGLFKMDLVEYNVKYY